MRAIPLFFVAVAAVAAVSLACGDGGIRRSPRDQPIPEPTCGDGIVNEGEDCDGSDLAEQSCTGLGFDLGTLSCDASCKFSTGGCVKFCGNGTIDVGEQCDGALGPLGCDGWGYRSCSDSCQVESNTCRTASFTAGPTLQMTSGGPSVIADLVPTGYGDLISAVPGFGRLQTHAWKPAQGFTPDRILSRTDSQVPLSPIAGDLDGDGRVDVAAINTDGSADRYRFTPATGSTPAGFVVENLSPSPTRGDPVCETGPWLGSGKLLGGPGDDLVALACAGLTGSITWDGAVVFPSGAAPLPAVRVVEVGVRHGTLGDVNGDEKGDLVLSKMNGDVVVRLAPDFAAATDSWVSMLGALSLRVADLDGDGDGDLIAFVGSELMLLENTGTGVAVRRQLPAQAFGFGLARDLDGDGRVDLAWLEGDRLELRRNVGEFTFTAQHFPTGAGLALSLSAGDVEGDGDLDLAATYKPSTQSEATTTYVFLNAVK